jgi:copper chaperone CopZ
MKLLVALLLPALLLVGCLKTDGLETAAIKADTMVCGSCAKNVEKALYAVEGVKSVHVDLDKKLVEVKYVPAQTNLGTLEHAVTDAGYDANDKKRDPGAYDKLDACCKKES